MNLLGIDTGGTFTDLVYYDGNTITTHKVLSSPDAPERAILQGIHDMQIPLDERLHVIHGSTVATNAVLEGKGVTTAYITNRGFKDVLSIGRQARKELYNLTPKPVAPPVPADYCLETGGRLDANADVLEPLTNEDLNQLANDIDRLRPEAVAINLLFSYLDASFEEQIEQALAGKVFVSRSSKILPVYREYERGITTWLNAYVGPLMQGYLRCLQDKLGKARLSIMRSSGQTCEAEQAGEEAVHLLLSGPAGGLAAAKYLSTQLQTAKLLTFDMGGTSTDVAMFDGAIELTGNGRISGYPVGVPMVNIHTIGAGGGSIAYVDEGGLLQVGPESAGAAPGPACYGQGGARATVTDANLVLGRIPSSIRFGESMTVDSDAAVQAISRLTEQLDIDSIKETALGIIRIANEHMAQALRVISVERGIDPREFTLAAFGGAGGLHVCELADQLDMRRALVPDSAGVLSAWGMLVAQPGRFLTRTVGQRLEAMSDDAVNDIVQVLYEEGEEKLRREGHTAAQLSREAVLELCYQGQAHTLKVAWEDVETCRRHFAGMHRERYGHELQSPIELVNIRIGIRRVDTLSLPVSAPVIEQTGEQRGQNEYLFRQAMSPGKPVTGPISICDAGSTIWLAPGWTAERDAAGHLLLNKTTN